MNADHGTWRVASLVALTVATFGACDGGPGDDSVGIAVSNDCAVPVRATFVNATFAATRPVGAAFASGFPYMDPGRFYFADIVYHGKLPKGTAVLVVETSTVRLVERTYDIADVAKAGSVRVRGTCSGPLVCRELADGSVECSDQ